MSIKSFQELNLWRKSHELVLSIYTKTKIYPSEERFGLVSQIRRSASSICANIAEGFVKSKRDYLRYLNIAHGSLEETKYHLILSKDLGYISHDDFALFDRQCIEIGKMFTVLKKCIKADLASC